MNRLLTASLVLGLNQALLAQGGPPPHGGGDAPLHPLDEYRAIDGRDNNEQEADWGATGSLLLRLAGANYADGVGLPADARLASPRWVSNQLSSQPGPMPNAQGVSDYVWMWGQFLDHDITETPVLDPAEPYDIPVPTGDVWFDPQGTGAAVIPFSRSYYELAGGVRQQANEITAWIDASNVYGSDPARALALRRQDGSGKLKTSPGDLLPFNTEGFPNAPSSAPSYFLAGDFRANEQAALTAMHALFVREHNHWAEQIVEATGGGGHPHQPQGHGSGDRRPRGHGGGQGGGQGGPGPLSGDQIYELARAIVGAEMQAITYREFLPVLLGPGALAPPSGYHPEVNPSISNEFATACYRFGHTMLSPTLLRLGPGAQPIPAGPLALRDAFFNPNELITYGVDPLLRGLAFQEAQEVDEQLVDDVRNFLFGPPGSGGFDLASLNLQRGRDHGLASYNETRLALGLVPAANFAEVSFDPAVQDGLAASYRNVDQLELWIGGLCEDPLPGALVGSTISAVLARQFEALRDGDRFWYRRHLPQELVELVENQTLTRILRRNTGLGSELPMNPFRVPQ